MSKWPLFCWALSVIGLVLWTVSRDDLFWKFAILMMLNAIFAKDTPTHEQH